MSADRIAEVGKLAWLPAGRRSKWAVLVFWFIVAGVAARPSGKLMGAQENDAVSWLPRAAESTKVIQAVEKFQSQDEFPAIVVYERAGQVTPQDMAAVTSQVVTRVHETEAGPVAARSNP